MDTEEVGLSELNAGAPSPARDSTPSPGPFSTASGRGGLPGFWDGASTSLLHLEVAPVAPWTAFSPQARCGPHALMMRNGAWV